MLTIGIPVNISTSNLKLGLETLPGMGVVDVTPKDDACSNKEWLIEWITVGGDRPTLTS